MRTAKDPRLPRKIIRNFDDFLAYHSDHSPIYFYNNRLYISYNLTFDLKYRYRIEEPYSIHSIEKSIVNHPELFDRYPAPYFYFPRETFAKEEQSRNLPGEILIVKKGRKYHDHRSSSQV